VFLGCLLSICYI